MKTKLFAIALTLCLMLGALAGMTAFAAEEMEAKPQRWGEFYADRTVGGITTFSSEFVSFSANVALDRSAAYQVSFRYATSSAAFQYQILNDDASFPYIPRTALPATYAAGGDEVYKTHTLTLIPSKDPTLTGKGYRGLRIFIWAPNDGTSLKIDDNAPYQTKVVKLSAAEAACNGSAEIVENGEAVNISGGELITEGAKDGQNMMKVTAAEAMTMNLIQPIDTITDPASGVCKAKIRGFMKAEGMTDGSAVTVTFYNSSTDGDVLATKTYTYSATDAALNDIQNGAWEYFRFSALPMEGQVAAKFEVTGEGSVYVDGVTIEEDKNLFPDSRYVNASGLSDSAWEFNPTAGVEGSQVVIGTDGNCPDGQNYMKLENTAALQGRPAGYIPVEANTRYLMSFWYKSDNCVRVNPFFITGSYAATPYFETKSGETWSPYNRIVNDGAGLYLFQLDSTDNKWEHIAALITVPVDMSLKMGINFNSGNAEFCNFSVEKVDEKTIRFYEPSVMSATRNATLLLALEPYNIPSYTVLGKPVEVLDETNAENIMATCLTPVLDGDAQKLSADKMIFATYKTVNGAQCLTGIQIGEAAAYGTSAIEGVNCTANAGACRLVGAPEPLNYMNYPSVSLGTDAIKGADSVRVFCWNSTAGLTPVGDVATIR